MLDRRMVVDATVVGAAGNGGAGVASSCRDVLDYTFSVCHKAVTYAELAEEWDDHRCRAYVHRDARVRNR